MKKEHMTDDELVERMAKVMALQPWDELHPGSKARLLSDARAVLAVAEPVIRERQKQELIATVRAHRFKPDARLGGGKSGAAALIAPMNARAEIIEAIRTGATP